MPLTKELIEETQEKLKHLDPDVMRSLIRNATKDALQALEDGTNSFNSEFLKSLGENLAEQLNAQDALSSLS